MIKKIEVRAAITQVRVLEGQCDLILPFDTINDAKKYAKYCLTDEYHKKSEASQPLRYSQVCVDDKCVADYFAKGWDGFGECKKCNYPLYQDDKYVNFSTNTVPLRSLSLKLRAVWCGNCDYTDLQVIPNKTVRII